MTTPSFDMTESRVPARVRTQRSRRAPFAEKHTNDEKIADLVRSAGDEVWDLSVIQTYLAQSVDQILKRRAVPKAQVVAPRMEIAVPAIEAMRYCRFREELAALIAKAMDRRSAHFVHPAFVDVLKQVTQDELAILSLFPGPEQVIATGHLHLVTKAGQTQILHRHILPSAFANVCALCPGIPTYVDNLLRLELITVPTNLMIKNDEPYETLLNQKFCRPLFAVRRKNAKLQLERGVLALTAFGQSFKAACML